MVSFEDPPRAVGLALGALLGFWSRRGLGVGERDDIAGFAAALTVAVAHPWT